MTQAFHMTGKVVVITGATSGIGQSAAEQLAIMGAKIVQIARNRTRGEHALRRLRMLAPDAAHAIHYADLAQIAETRRVATDIANTEPRIDVLINNAGALFNSYQTTPDGLERTFALNHLAYFVLTQCLWERLTASTPARVVNVASDGYRLAVLDFDDLQSVRAYRGTLSQSLLYGGPGFHVYARSKLCNILFTRELARRLAGTGVTANCLHPGFVATRFADQTGGLISFSMRIAKRFAKTPDEGAKTVVHLASAPEVNGITGSYFHQCRTTALTEAALDDTAAQRLWRESAILAS